MIIPKKFDRYTNYNVYIIANRKALTVEVERLFAVIAKMQQKYKKPYIRFMWTSDATTAMCILYSDYKKNERATKLVPFDEVEQIVMEDKK